MYGHNFSLLTIIYLCISSKSCFYCEQTAGLRSANFCTYVWIFRFKSSTALTFSFKVKDWNQVRWEVQTWLSRKRWPMVIANLESCMWSFDWNNYIWPWLILKVRVKVMHISTVNISRTVTQKQILVLPINRMSHKTFPLAYLYLTLTHSKGQG